MKLLARIIVLFDRLLDMSASLSATILIFIMLLVCAGVILRYFVHQPILWAFEISEVALLYITFLGTAWVLRREAHVKMDILLNRLRPKVQLWFNIVSSIIGVIVSSVLIWYGAVVTINYFQRGTVQPTAVELPIAPIFLIIPLGSILLFFQFLRRGYRHFVELRAPG